LNLRDRPGTRCRFDHGEGMVFAPEGAEVHSQGRSPWKNEPGLTVPPRRGGGGLGAGPAHSRGDERPWL
jgi:hypothetical protein